VTLQVGVVAERSLMVTERETAQAWGSGAASVLATPQMIALMEGAAVAAVDHLLDPGTYSVGIRVDVRHLAATTLGERVTARAELLRIDGQRLVFRVTAKDSAGIVGEGTHERFVVNGNRFMSRARARTGAPHDEPKCEPSASLT